MAYLHESKYMTFASFSKDGMTFIKDQTDFIEQCNDMSAVITEAQFPNSYDY